MNIDELKAQYTGFNIDEGSMNIALYQLSMEDSDRFEQLCDHIEEFHKDTSIEDKLEWVGKWVFAINPDSKKIIDYLIMDNYIYPLVVMGYSQEELDKAGALGLSFNRHKQYFNPSFPETAMIRYLMNKGCSVNAQDSLGRTAVHEMATTANLIGFFKNIIPNYEEQWDVNIQNCNGDTPLHMLMACAAHSDDTMELMVIFIMEGADLSIKAKDGNTALDIAKNVHPELYPKISEIVAMAVEERERA